MSRAVTILQGMGGSKEQAGEIDNGEGPSTPRPKAVVQSSKMSSQATPVTKAIHSKKAASAVVIGLDMDAGTESDRDDQNGLDIDYNMTAILRNMGSTEVLPESVQGFDGVLLDIQDDEAGDAGGHESSAATTGGNRNVMVDELTQDDQDTDAAKVSSASAQKKKKGKKEKVKDGKGKAPVLGDITTSAVNGATGGSHGTKHPSDMESDATETNEPQGKCGRGRPAKPKA